jgi:hypothetical protein
MDLGGRSVRQTSQSVIGGQQSYNPAFSPDEGASCKTPLTVQNVSGHDFSRAGRAIKSCWALQAAEKPLI